MRDLKFVQACPDDAYYIWQVHLWLESLKERGHSDKAVSLIFTPIDREISTKWQKLQDLYPEAEFNFYKDNDSISKLLPVYIPIIRPYVLWRYFKEHPEMSEKAIFYCDSDVLFTEKFDITKYIEDDINYLSNTLSYISATYFDSKIKDVLPEKLEEYKTRDILQECCSLIGISREIAEKHNDHSGGAQYLLKNIDYTFWEDVITSCIRIRLHLQSINKEFFGSEDKGFQSWCADMWAILWNLWKKEREAKIVPEMSFTWSSDSIEKLNEVGIFHNAGIVSKMKGDIPVFYKGEYHLGKDPFTDPHLEVVYKNEKSKELANWYYVSKMIDLREKHYN